MLQNCGIDAHRHIYRLLTRPSTCYGAQYVRHLVSPLNQNRRVLSGLILLLFISGISAIRLKDFRHPDMAPNVNVAAVKLFALFYPNELIYLFIPCFNIAGCWTCRTNNKRQWHYLVWYQWIAMILLYPAIRRRSVTCNRIISMSTGSRFRVLYHDQTDHHANSMAFIVVVKGAWSSHQGVT